MKDQKRLKIIFITVLFISQLLLSGCVNKQEEAAVPSVSVVVETGEGFLIETPCEKAAKGEDVTFILQMEEGYLLESASYPDYEISYSGNENCMALKLKEVRYSTVVTVTTRKSELCITYVSNGGKAVGENKDCESIIIPVADSHQRVNTAIGTELFYREGYTLIGWNTEPDGSGVHIGLGSRTDASAHYTLYAEWAAWSQEEDFSYEQSQGQTRITDYTGTAPVVVIPGSFAGCPVVSIAKDAFRNTAMETVIFPLSLQSVEEGAFLGSDVREIYLYDNLSYINDYAFEGCSSLRTLHINAVEKPAYSGTYFDTFQDKYDRLLSLKEKQKIVLFSGSSTRFGYDSERIDKAFPGYEVVNMGVFAYTNAAPQLMLILDCMQEGDILLHAPEFDAAKRQFCTSYDIDEAFFCMMESDYDTMAKLDLRLFHKEFSAFYTYLSNKSTMAKKSYALSPSDFDEEGNTAAEKSYNEYGDYILYRPDSESTAPVYGLAVEYTVEAFPKAQYLDPVNEMYRRFLDKGIFVYFTYAPRNQYALSSDSTQEAREALDRYLRKELTVPVISKLEESLYPGTYLCGTDNHLSTEGVEIRTERIIADLKQQMAAEGIWNE